MTSREKVSWSPTPENAKGEQAFWSAYVPVESVIKVVGPFN